MRPDLYWIPGPWSGKLAIAARPRGGDWLEDEIRGWKDAGIQSVVSFLTPDEAAELDLTDEARLCDAVGITFIPFPTPDRGVPPSSKEAAETLTALLTSLQEGQSVALHCRQGIGRSGLAAASLLGLAGEKADGAMRKVSEARGLAVPETAEQRDWVRRFLASR